jgi:hypothetical protein
VVAEGDDLGADALARSRSSGKCGLSRGARRCRRAPGRENLGLGLGDGLDRREVAQVHGLDRRDDATCGRTISASGVISPAWFMPISSTA